MQKESSIDLEDTKNITFFIASFRAIIFSEKIPSLSQLKKKSVIFNFISG